MNGCILPMAATSILIRCAGAVRARKLSVRLCWRIMNCCFAALGPAADWLPSRRAKAHRCRACCGNSLHAVRKRWIVTKDSPHFTTSRTSRFVTMAGSLQLWPMSWFRTVLCSRIFHPVYTFRVSGTVTDMLDCPRRRWMRRWNMSGRK